jgi:dolichol-phosphate mannosyltransferase
VSRAAWIRILKFALVGAIGIGVQLGALAFLIEIHIHYMLATALAVECSLIHNFLWHRYFTWSDRAQSNWRSSLASLLRFHLSNGLISLIGNLVLMRVLVGVLSMPPLCANLLAIAACFVANFVASDCWVFVLPGT